MKAVSVIIPAFNEEHTIKSVIEAYEQHPYVTEVIVVTDGCTDATAAQARLTGAKVIELSENVGKGDAMAKGVKLAKEDLFFFPMLI